MAKIVEIYRMCRFNIVNVREYSQTAINHFAWAALLLTFTVIVNSSPKVSPVYSKGGNNDRNTPGTSMM